MPTNYSTNFIGDFLLGDNIKENVDALQIIWDKQTEFNNADPKRKRLRKPIIVLCGSVTEALLFDFYSRIRDFVREGVDGIEEELAEHFRSMNNDNFQFFIDQSKKHQIFGDGADGFYGDLCKLAKLRNRIHIQNVMRLNPLCERELFLEASQTMAERTLEKTIYQLARDYNRNQEDHVGGITLPWNSYFNQHQ